MTKHHTITRALLLTSLCLPLLAAKCPGSTQAHGGEAWVANQPDHVMLFEFKEDGAAVMAVEQYNANPLIDGMKLEIHASCKPQGERDEEGHYELVCTDVRIARATQGIAVLFDSVSLLEAYLDDGFDEKSPETSTMTLEIKVEGDTLTLYEEANEKRPARETVFEKVASHKVDPFLERFRVDTVELQYPAANRRERDLP